MEDTDKTKEQLIQELGLLRQQLAEAEALRADHRCAEGTLERSEAKFRDLVERTSAGIAAIDLEGRVTLANEALCKIIGYSQEELIGSPFANFLHPDDKGRILELFWNAPEDPIAEPHLEFRVPHKNGHIVYCHSSPAISWYQGEKAGFSAVIHDITERKRIEEALRENEARYQRLFEDAVLGIFQSTPEGKAIAVNPAFARMFGYESPEDVIATVKDVATDLFADPERRSEILHLMAEKPDSRTFENVYRRKDGSTFVGNLHVWSVRGADGCLLHVEGFIEDITARKLAESQRDATLKALRDSESQYRTTLNAMGDMIHVVDDNLQIVLFNEALRQRNEQLGLDTDIVGKTIHELYPFLSQKVLREYDEVFRNGRLLVTEGCNQVGDKEIITETRKIPIRGGDRVVQVITVIRDITERKRAEAQRDATLEALCESEGKLRSVIEQSADGIVLANEQGIVVEWNRAQEQITSLKRSEALGKPVWDVLYQVLFPQEQQNPTIHKWYKATIVEFLKTGQAAWLNRLTEGEVERSDGTRRNLQAIMSPIKTNKGFMSVSVIRDITERKRAEEEIRHQAETLTALHETALDLAAQRSLPDLLRAIVVRATTLLKARSGDIYLYRLAGDGLESALAYNLGPDSEGTVFQRSEGLSVKVLESGQSLIVADHREDRSEQRMEAPLTAVVTVPIRWGDQLLGILDLVNDAQRTFSLDDVALLERFTPLAAAALENNRLLRDLQEQIDRLKVMQAQLVQAAKLAGVGELAAGVAHELNNPLTSILGFAQLLLNATPPDASARNDLEIIANQARRGRDIVRNLLDFARQTKPQRLPADVNQVLHQTLDLIQQYLEKSGVVIEKDCAPDVGLLTLDSGQMKQVFLNLITNAAQAMPKGGKLNLRTACVGSEVAISVSDTGQGMPPEIRERIFEPFFTTKATGEGTGLGLSVSLGIVQAHGGRIAVESQVGQGSTFTVWLPIET